ncbi:thiopeptide maturation pyridine synthase [Couchioplanes azureus]|uniref:thiopeptide maturation pyridine synthase n=1 Tax=Couchioplanes caeruleus TaxID=56438 RepID=UPI00167143DB|nr:thiopeptide maturation pyridine synthase [Couchioplanes caeruleus]
MSEDSSRWHGVQLYYYEENKDGLLLECVRPLFAELAPHAERLVVTRHWLRGPHLRLGVRAPDRSFREVIRPAVERAVSRYLAASPSTAVLDERELLAVHEVLAPQEQEWGPLSPFHPDNSLQWAPYDRRIPVLGSEAAAELLEDFYHETNELVFGALAHVRGGGGRLALAFDLMVATAHAMWPGIDRGFISYRSHAEGFIVRAPDPGARRASCDDRYRAQAPALRERLVTVLDGLDGPGQPVPFVAGWLAVLRRYREVAERLIASGELSFAAAERAAGPGGEGEGWNPEMLRHSDFHRKLQGPGGAMQALQRDPDFLAFRFALNYLYLHLNRIGVRPVERFLLCHLVANAVEEHYGISAGDFVASGPPRR